MRLNILFRYMFFLVFVLMSSKAVADDNIIDIKQKSIIDSLKQLLTIHPVTENRKLEIYSFIANAYHASDYDSSVFYAHKSLKLAQKLKANEKKIDIYCTLGLNYSFRSNYDSAFFYFNRMKEIATARNVAIYIIRSITDLSLPAIGKIFGRDHTTILSSVRAIENEIENNLILSNKINDIANIAKS